MAVKFEGVYSSSKNFGESYSKSAYRKFYWFVWSVDEYTEEYLIHQLDATLSPLYKPFVVKKVLFLSNAVQEKRISSKPNQDLIKSDDFLNLTNQIKVNQVENKVKIAFDSNTNSLVDNFEDDFLNSLLLEADNLSAKEDTKSIVEIDREAKQVDTSLRSDFAVALINFRQGNKEQAVEVFSALAKQTKGIHQAHKHMFTDFAVGLRKCKLMELALEHSLRAVELSKDDAHAYFNTARLYFELGKKTEALSYISTALTLDPKLEVARTLLVVLNKKSVLNLNSSSNLNKSKPVPNKFSQTIYKYK